MDGGPLFFDHLNRRSRCATNAPRQRMSTTDDDLFAPYDDADDRDGQLVYQRTEEDDAEMAALFRALSDPKRIAIIYTLSHGEMSGVELQEALSLSQSGLAYHLKHLIDTGFVSARPEGRKTYYSLDSLGRMRLLAAMADFSRVHVNV